MPESRKKSGIITGVIGLCCNVILGAGKLAVGLITGSVSIATDAANNLSDCGASVVTISSFAMANKEADKEHPFGHGRYEYIASFIIGFIILVVGLQFAIESVKRIITPQEVTTNTLGIVILAASIGVKFFMFIFYRIRAKAIHSDALKAASMDSLFDCIITGGVLISFIINKYVSFNIDGICGLLVAAVVLFGGGKVVFDTVSKLLGNGSDPMLSEKLYGLVMDNPLVIGAHDLCVHDYGPSRRIGTVHAEFDRDLSITEAHKIIDAAELRALEMYGVELCIHVDPIDVSDPSVNRLRAEIKEVLKHYHNSSVHELSISAENNNISFGVKLPQKYGEIKQNVADALKETVLKSFPDYEINIGFDIIYKS